jgi:hypothetical protein
MKRERDTAKLREYSKRHYENNRETMIAKSKAAKPATKAAARAAILDYLTSHPCVDCGEEDPVVLEFDHRENKEFEIGSTVRMGVGIPRLMAEIAKCDVRCANCHRRKTYRERGFSHRD